MNKEEFLAAFATALGVELPSAAEIDELLKLASVAAHGSERPAAPLACYLAGVSGRPAAELIQIAAGIAPDLSE